jgi:hypothetical protein
MPGALHPMRAAENSALLLHHIAARCFAVDVDAQNARSGGCSLGSAEQLRQISSYAFGAPVQSQASTNPKFTAANKTIYIYCPSNADLLRIITFFYNPR